MDLHPGIWQFVYNIGNGDVRTYDIFPDGQVRERIARTNDMSFIPTDEALDRIDIMIGFAEREKERFKNTALHNKITKTKLDILLTIRRFMIENPVKEDEVRLS
jgi:hypothetical protein